MMRALLMLVLLANLSCAAEGDNDWLAKELQTYLPKGVSAVVVYPGEDYELVKIRWEKPFVMQQFVINGPPDDAPHCSLVHDPISIRISPDKSLGEVYAHKAKYFAVRTSVIEWEEKLKDMPGINFNHWGFGGPEDWLRSAKPKTADQRQLMATYETFLTNEYVPVMARSRVCPNFNFKGRFIRLKSDLDEVTYSFEPSGVDAIQDILRTIISRCDTIEKY